VIYITTHTAKTLTLQTSPMLYRSVISLPGYVRSISVDITDIFLNYRYQYWIAYFAKVGHCYQFCIRTP